MQKGASRAKPRLPVMGEVTAFEVHVAAATGRLADEDRLKLATWRRANVAPVHQALWMAAVEGVAERLMAQYVARWAKAHSCPEAVWNKSAAKHRKHFTEAASWLLENGFQPERMIAVCEELVLASRRVKYPIPRQLYSGYVLDMIPEWIPPNERKSRDEGISPDDMRRATDDALRQTRDRRDPWVESDLGMMGIDFTETDQEWRKQQA